MKIKSNMQRNTKMHSLFMMAVFLFPALTILGQVKYSSKDQVVMILTGTSTLHDWDMKSTSGTCEASFTMDNNGGLSSLQSMKFSTPVTSLKSGKGGMDKNAYKALNTDAHSNITATLKSANVKVISDNTYSIESVILLTVAGKTLETNLVTTAVINADKSISVTGQKEISMRDYDVSPPSFMLGAVKTGNDVVLNFNIKLKSS